MSLSSMSLPHAGLPSDAVVGAHQRIRAALANARLEVRQIALAQVALAARPRRTCGAPAQGRCATAKCFTVATVLKYFGIVALQARE